MVPHFKSKKKWGWTLKNFKRHYRKIYLNGDFSYKFEKNYYREIAVPFIFDSDNSRRSVPSILKKLESRIFRAKSKRELRKYMISTSRQKDVCFPVFKKDIWWWYY